MAEDPKVLPADRIEWVEDPAIEQAVEQADQGDLPEADEDGRPGSEHEDEGWRAARLSKP